MGLREKSILNGAYGSSMPCNADSPAEKNLAAYSACSTQAGGQAPGEMPAAPDIVIAGVFR